MDCIAAQDDAAKMRRNGEFASGNLRCAGCDSFSGLVKMGFVLI